MNKPPEMGYSQHDMYGEQEMTFEQYLKLPLHWESTGEDSKYYPLLLYKSLNFKILKIISLLIFIKSVCNSYIFL